MIAILRTKLDGDLEIGHRGIGFSGEAVERRERVMNVVGLRGSFAGLDEAFPRVVPPADIHHRHAALIMFVRRARILLMRRLHPLFCDAHVHARAISKFFAGSFKNFFQFLFGSSEFLLVKQRQGFVVELELSLNARIDQFHTPALCGRRRT